MGIDRPVREGLEMAGEPVIGIVVDAEIQVEAGAGDQVALARLKMNHISQPGERSADIGPGGIRPKPVVEDQCNAVGCSSALIAILN